MFPLYPLRPISPLYPWRPVLSLEACPTCLPGDQLYTSLSLEASPTATLVEVSFLTSKFLDTSSILGDQSYSYVRGGQFSYLYNPGGQVSGSSAAV
jgi:hypothetical protein